MKHLFTQVQAIALCFVFAGGLLTACGSKPDAGQEAKIAELEKKVAEYEASAKLAADNLVLMEKYDMEAWNNKDSVQLAGLHHPDLKAYFNGGEPQDFAKHIAGATGLFKSPMFPKNTGYAAKVAQGDWTAAIEEYEYAGADGKPKKGAFATFVKWQDGKVIDERVLIDMAAINAEMEKGKKK
jgi:hypothetical protein